MSYDPEVCCYLDPYIYVYPYSRRSRVILCLLPRWQLNVNVVLPHPRSLGGKPQRLTARVKIASARPYFPQPRFAGGANFRFVCPCLSGQSDVPNLGGKAVLVAPSNAATQISPPAEEASM